MSEWFLGILTLFVSLLLTFTFVGIGWYLIWKYLLSRFRFVRVLFGYPFESEEEKPQKFRGRRVRTIK